MADDREIWRETIEVVQQLRDDWRIHREVINRAVVLLNHEVVSFGQRLDKDDGERKERQALLDRQLAALHQGLGRVWTLLRWLLLLVIGLGVAATVWAWLR